MAYEISEIKQKELRDFFHNWGVHTTQQIPGHNFMGKYVEHMFENNNNPQVEYKDHYWELVTVCKTQTWNTRWVIRMNGKLFTVVQGMIYRIGASILFFETDDKKNGTCNLTKHIKQYPMIVDMVTACDFFAAEYMAQRILDGRFDNIMNRTGNE